MEEKTWTTKEGEEIPYSKLEDSHLLNILKWIEKRAEDGITFTTGGGHSPEDFWLDETDLIGEDVLEHYNYKVLCKEALRRDLLTAKEFILKN